MDYIKEITSRLSKLDEKHLKLMYEISLRQDKEERDLAILEAEDEILKLQTKINNLKGEV